MTPAPTGEPIVLSHFDERVDYVTWRPAGTLDWLIILTVAGAGRFSADPGFDAVVGDVVALAPGVPHDYATSHLTGRWELLWAHVTAKPEWPSMLDWPLRTGGVRALRLSPGGQTAVRSAFDEAILHHRSASRWRTELAYNALERALLLCSEEAEDHRVPDAPVRAALAHVQSHLAFDLSVEHLARVARLSPSRFAHVFREQVGTPPQRYVERQRIVAASQMLAFTSSPIAVVASAVGFADPLYFSRRFRTVVGRSPSAYRDEARRGSG